MKENTMKWGRALRTAGAIRRSGLCAAAAVMLASTGMLTAAGSTGARHQRFKEAPRGAELLLEINPYEGLYDKLPSERDVPELRDLIEKWDALPKKTIPHTTTIAGWKPVRIAVHEVGSGTHNHVYVCIHGILASYLTWRYVAAALPPDSDLWIVDLPGHGESDPASPASLGPDGYAPGPVAERIVQALEQEIASRPTAPRITLVGHSLGGMIALRMLSSPEIRRQHRAFLSQVDDAVLFAPCDVGVGVQLGQLVMIAELSSLEVEVGDALGVVLDKVAAAEKEGCYRNGYATRESAYLLYKAFTTPATLKATQALIKEAVPGWATRQRPDWPEIRKLERNYKNITVPCLIVWGACDETLPEWMGYKLRDCIPGARLEEVPECMHSIPLEWPRKCADFIIAFDAGHRGPAAASPVAALPHKTALTAVP